MPIQRVLQAPPPGIFRGATPAASAGRWFDSNGVRFRQGQAQPIGGWAIQPNTGDEAYGRVLAGLDPNCEIV